MKKPLLLLGALLVFGVVAFVMGAGVEGAVQDSAAVEMAGVLPSQQGPVSILAFGDLMLDRAVRKKIDMHGPEYLFNRIAPLLVGHDLVVANAEGVFTEHGSVASFSNLTFTFATTTLPILKALGFTDLSQANNHALNFGWSGLNESVAAIATAGMQSFGDPENKNPGPVYQQVRGTEVAFVGYDQFASSGGEASSTLAAITQARGRGSFIIVYPHWGEEYNAGVTTLQSTLAHAFVDAGANVVIGSHPHVIEPVEIYKGKAIFYSLGNFVFDQWWNAAVSHGLGVSIVFNAHDVFYTLIPFSIMNAQPTPVSGDEASSTLAAAGITKRSFVLDR